MSELVIRAKGQLLKVPITAKTTCKNLYTDIGKLISEKVKSLKLIFKGKTIDNDTKKISEVGILPNSKILVLMRDPNIKDSPTGKLTKKGKKGSKDSIKCYETNKTIIEKGPPEGCILGMKSSVQQLPSTKFITYDNNGLVSKLSLESSGTLWVEYDNGTNERLFDVECQHITDLEKYEDQYVAAFMATNSGPKVFYFIPKQYSETFKDFFNSVITKD